MSIILDALKKSERERQAGQVPGMSEVVTEPVRVRLRWIPWIVGLLALVNVGGIGYWLYRDHPAKVAMPGQSTPVPEATAPPQQEAKEGPISPPQMQAPWPM